MHSLKKLYHWVLGLSASPRASWALSLIAFAESSFFPIPPDLLLIPMGVSKPKKALWYATLCTFFSVLGGCFGYWIGAQFWELTSYFFYDIVPGFTPELFLKVSQTYQEHAFFAVFAAGFTPIPYKVFTLAAGVSAIDFPTFVLASILARGLRFYLISVLLFFFGEKVQSLIEKHFNVLTILLTVLLFGGFFAIKFLAN